ncbi:MAG TPA: glycine cleavage T C-terminal barrel domain-containing protein [Planctomycetaceae bacterium]|jgi:folate-binding protein YgfZ|nr:glycine cleavage T C-terminal barrel domain-containing protein [Planctomycetaceae bacterium]
MPSTSDLRDHQREAGAVFASAAPASIDVNGLPLHFGNPREEYAAAATCAALLDWSDHGLIELKGKDRVTFLHGFCTNDIKRLAVGRDCEAFVTNVKGRILGHIWVEAGEAALRLDAGPGSPARLCAHLERYIINEDAVITDVSPAWGELLVIGPSAAVVFSNDFGDVAGLGPWQHIEAEGEFGQTRISRRDVGGQSANVVGAPRAALGAIWDVLSRAGARPAGSAVWSALRIEAGLPIWGVDLTDENLAQEAGRTPSAISFTKGCYLGQEPIARIDAMGHVNRELRSLRISGEAIPSPGARIFSDAAGSAAVGTVSSAAFSFGSNSAVAMAMLRSNASAPGTQVFVETDGVLLPATVFWFPAERSA